MTEFDYIIVGAGSAGCALAYRLIQESGASVALVEAGGSDGNPMIKLPRGFTKILEGTKEVWHYQTDPNVAGPNPIWMRGKVLGGSSSVNGMVWMRGRPADYDSLDIPGWGWDDISKCYRAFENHQLGAGGDRGTDGPLNITVHSERSDICDAVIEAAVDNGATETVDLNQEDGAAVGYQPCNIYKGQRVSAAEAFLKPIKKNGRLTIFTETLTDRVAFEGKRAVGVEVRSHGRKSVLKAKKEVILSAGTLHSPKILMLSGIGPAATLAQHGIELRVEAPDVGQNMSEQLGFMPMFRLTEGSQNKNLYGLGLVKSLFNYAFRKKGPLTHACFEMSAVIKTSAGHNRPNAIVQFGTVSVDFDKATGRVVPDKKPGAMMTCYLMYPKSRGYLTITSADPDAPITWDPRYLTHPQDRADSVDLVRAVRQLVSHPKLKKYGFTEMSPGPSVQTDEEILDFFLKYGTYAYHALGTCRMGTDAASVVDPTLKVRGVEGLRVADISVMPDMVSSHTNAPAIAVGWRAADFILADNRAAA